MKVVIIIYLIFSLGKLGVSVRNKQPPQNHIIGGTEAPEKKYPWLGILQEDNIGIVSKCAAVLIANPFGNGNRYVLTTAHCVDDYSKTYYVTFGAHDRTDSRVGQPERFNVLAIQIHPYWNSNSFVGFPNDIALLTLDNNADHDPSNEYISAIKFTDVVDDRSDCWLAGWGATACTTGDGPAEDVVHEGQVPDVELSKCNETWHQTSTINRAHVCAGNTNTGACYGDSSSPMQCVSVDANNNTVATLLGITSFVYPGCDTSYPTVLTSIEWYFSWILCLIQKGGTDPNDECKSHCFCGLPEYCPPMVDC